MKTQKPKVEVRWIDDDDPTVVANISQLHFGKRGLTAKKVYAFIGRADHIPKILRIDGKTVGYLFYHLDRGLVLIEEIAVTQPRQGHGRRLIRHLLASLPKLRRSIAAIRVPETNLDAQLFFRKMGFKAFRVVKPRGKPPYYAMKFTVPSARE